MNNDGGLAAKTEAALSYLREHDVIAMINRAVNKVRAVATRAAPC